jgi:hypothetical protein
MKTYTFHVSLPGTGRVWRKIEMGADQTLEDLHYAIQDAFAWDADHMYSFFLSGKAWDRNTEYCLPEGYTAWGEPMLDYAEDDLELEGEEEEELTPDQREQALRALFAGGEGMTVEEMESMLVGFIEDLVVEDEAEPGSVLTTTIEELALKPRQEFMYLFDYGDEWRFKVRVSAIDENADPDAAYPRLVESVGEAPPQYPEWDDEEEWEEESEEDEG